MPSFFQGFELPDSLLSPGFVTVSTESEAEGMDTPEFIPGWGGWGFVQWGVFSCIHVHAGTRHTFKD